jgi:hypothetical protein
MMDSVEIKGTPVRTRQQLALAEASLDRRAIHMAAITPHVPIFVCRNLLKLADADFDS